MSDTELAHFPLRTNMPERLECKGRLEPDAVKSGQPYITYAYPS